MSDDQRTALDRIRNPLPVDRARMYLSQAIHAQRCGSNPDHGPYKHEDEASFYAELLRDEIGLGGSVHADLHKAEAEHWRTCAKALEKALRAIETSALQNRLESDIPPPEPPVGTTFRHQSGVIQWTRHEDGWRCTSSTCFNCPCDWSEACEVGGVLDMERVLP